MGIRKFTRRQLVASATALAATGLALGLTAGPALAAQPNQEWSGSGHWLGNPASSLDDMRLQTAWGQKCLTDVAYQQVVVDTCNGAETQSWEQDPGADPGTWVYSSQDSYCLDAQDGWAFNSAPVKGNLCNSLFAANSGAYKGSQEWIIGPDSELESYNDFYNPPAWASGPQAMCIDVNNTGQDMWNGTPADGTQVQLWTCAY